MPLYGPAFSTAWVFLCHQEWVMSYPWHNPNIFSPDGSAGGPKGDSLQKLTCWPFTSDLLNIHALQFTWYIGMKALSKCQWKNQANLRLWYCGACTSITNALGCGSQLAIPIYSLIVTYFVLTAVLLYISFRLTLEPVFRTDYESPKLNWIKLHYIPVNPFSDYFWVDTRK